jgi:cytochrome c peroxidase
MRAFGSFRIITGITGFDSPIAQKSIPEAAAALESIEIIKSMQITQPIFSKVLKTIKRNT